jgi:hypothetical protein
VTNFNIHDEKQRIHRAKTSQKRSSAQTLFAHTTETNTTTTQNESGGLRPPSTALEEVMVLTLAMEDREFSCLLNFDVQSSAVMIFGSGDEIPVRGRPHHVECCVLWRELNERTCKVYGL